MGYIVLFIFKDMDKINAVITGVGGYVPEDVLTNEDISKLVDTTDEWIMTRVGIKERRILKGEGLGTSYMGIRAVKLVPVFCMPWKQVPIISVRDAIRKWLLWQAIK